MLKKTKEKNIMIKFLGLLVTRLLGICYQIQVFFLKF